ncbi:MAG: zinc ABC transporter substrate-binding protein [Pirellulales bacterium]
MPRNDQLSGERGCLYLFGLMLLSLSIGCVSHAPHDSPDQAQLLVVATYSILGDWVQIVGGDHVKVTTLVGPGGDAHTYEPTPQDSVAIHRAALVFENGLGFETWLDKMFLASQTTAKRIVVTRELAPRKLSSTSGRQEFDPHVWHSPENAESMVHIIADALIERDPLHEADYRRRADDYIKELQSLDIWISEQVATIPEPRRRLVTTHDTFGYLADRYGFEVSSVMGSVSSEAADPAARELAAIVDRVRATKVPAVFTENIINPRLTEQVAREADVRIVATLFTDALGPPTSEGATYLEMMRFNVRTMTEALR